MNSPQSTRLSQIRSAFAYNQVSAWEKASWKKDALNLVKGLSIAIRSQGLCVTLAALLSRPQLHEKILADIVATWVLNNSPCNPLKQWENKEKHRQPGQRLLAACIEADRYAYQAAQHEACQIMEQCKLFACALYDKKKN